MTPQSYPSTSAVHGLTFRALTTDRSLLPRLLLADGLLADARANAEAYAAR